jgi:uncharacterized protein
MFFRKTYINSYSINIMLGHVFSYQNTPSLTKIHFQLGEGKEVNRGQFVCFKHPQGKLIGLVNDILRYNPYFESMYSDFDSINEKLPTAEWNKTIVEVKPLGLLDSGKFTKINFPPYPGSDVFMPSDQDLKDFLGFYEDGLNLGNVYNTETEVKVDLSRLLQKHFAILAMSGAGKSYGVSVLLEELLSIPKEKGPVAVVLFDVHGEYKNFDESVDPELKDKYKDFSKKTIHYDAFKIRFGLNSLSEGFISKIMGNLSAAQYRELAPIIKQLKSAGERGTDVFGFEDLRKAIEESKMPPSTKSVLIGKLAQAEALGLFGKTSSFSLSQMIEPGRLTIIDMSKIIRMDQKHIILAYFAERLFSLRREAKDSSVPIIPPFVLILEEAHQFVPEKSSADIAIARPIIETIAREGRKFGACLGLISQRPVNLSTTVLSQCNTHLLLRIINPNDLKHIQDSSEGLDAKSADMLTSLNVGEALLVGSAVNYPLFFKIRERKSQPNKYEQNLSEMSKDYLGKQKKANDDLDLYV